jgi:UDP-glucose 4,6-dehydratase
MYSNILVTGGCGFIGSNFINFMLEKYTSNGIRIYNIDKLDYCSDTNNIKSELISQNNYTFIKGNICDKDFISYILRMYNIECIVHFAAQTHVDNSFGNSLQFTMDNLLGTHTLLECCKYYQKETNNLKKFIHISTDEVYGEVDLDHPGCCEKSLLNPTNPYAATKAGAEFLVKSYYHSYKLPVIITRGNNVYGPRQYEEKLIPNFIQKLLKGIRCPVHGKGETRRNFIFTEDVSRAIDVIIEKGEINEIYNIGSNDEYSVMDILQILYERLQIEKPFEEVFEYVEDRPFNDFRYAIKTDNLHNLGWKQETSFTEGINKTIEWYKNL